MKLLSSLLGLLFSLLALMGLLLLLPKPAQKWVLSKVWRLCKKICSGISAHPFPPAERKPSRELSPPREAPSSPADPTGYRHHVDSPEPAHQLIHAPLPRVKAADSTPLRLRNGAWASVDAHVRRLPFASNWRSSNAIKMEDSRVTIDMHGLDVTGCMKALDAFLEECTAAGITQCRVITGIGNRSRRGPRLIHAVERRMRELRHGHRLSHWEVDGGHVDVDVLQRAQ